MQKTYVALIAAIACTFAGCWAEDLELDPDPLVNPSGTADEAKGGMLFRFAPVGKPADDLQNSIYWRNFENAVAAETAPVRLLIDNAPVVAPKEVTIKDRGNVTQYPVDGRKDLAEGKHVIVPGDIAIVMKAGQITSTHPAIKADENEVRVLCAPVRLEAFDTNGVPVPTAINVTSGKERVVRGVAKFTSLTMWLPVGAKYVSTFGTFSLAPDGKIVAEPADLAKDVKLTAEGLRLTVTAQTPAAPKSQPALHTFTQVLPGGKGDFIYFLNPFVKLDGVTQIAFSKKKYEAAAGAPFSSGDFSYHFDDGSSGPCSDTPAVPTAVLQSAAAELNVQSGDIVTLNVPCPREIGVAPVKIESKFLGTLKLSLFVADPAAPLYVIPYRLRTVFAETETGHYTVLLKSGFHGGAAQILCKSEAADAKALTLGALELPAVPENQCDSRQFTLKMSALPPGNYQLWLETGGTQSGHVPLSVVSWLRHSSFVVNYMNACSGTYPTDDAGLKVFHDCGVEVISSGGFGSIFGVDMPELKADLAAALRNEGGGLPPELATVRTSTDVVLQSMLKHQIRQLDFYPRALNFYCEGLSYHHSYKPTIDRMIRRLQIFTQQTMDYPSFYGMNYSWYPQLWGYHESGLDTDIHKNNRNAELFANLKNAGHVIDPANSVSLINNMTREEFKFYEENKFSDDAGKRASAAKLKDKATAFWKAEMDFGFGKHNKLYNDAIHEVLPGAACVLHENAGHDSGKRLSSLFNDMTAMTYESYSDYPEWPMSSSFTTDWAKGNCPDRPLWVVIDPGNSSEGMMKSLFHAFGRGAAGAGTIIDAEKVQECKHRGKGHQFVAQYGAIAARGVPDHRFVILATAAQQLLGENGQYGYHAMYYHLTRLGCAPVIADDEAVANHGVPAGTQVLFIVRQKQPLEPKVVEAIKAFTDKGGKVIVTGDSSVKVDGAIVVEQKITDIWQLGGFVTHPQMWKEFETNWEKPLSEALKKAGVPALASTDPHRGVVVTLDSGPLRYVVVIADEENQSWRVFKPNPALPVSLEGSGWMVRDLVKQQNLKTTEQDGRQQVSVDLITEPTTVLALYKTPPSNVTVSIQGEPRAGAELVFKADVFADQQPLGAVPIQIDITDATGAARSTIFRAAGEEVRFPVAALDQPGNWTIKVQELLTGVTVSAPVAVKATKSDPPAVAVGDVHVVNPDHVRRFFQRTQEKRIVIEPGQEKLLPIAQKLADQLTAAGVKTVVWKTTADQYDTIPIRWYPREDEDVPRWKLVDAVKLIGLRQNLTPYVDTIKGSHVPEKGGYGEVNPPYMVACDCIVFSGGRLAESLRAETAWMETPNVPGKGQGRVVVCFSPFLASYAALAVVANDEIGMNKAAGELAAYLKPAVAPVPVAAGDWKPVAPAGPVATAAVAQPFVAYSPVQHIRQLWVNHEGAAVVCLDSKKDVLAFVDKSGKVTNSCGAELQEVAHTTFDDTGNLWIIESRHTQGEWYIQDVFLRCINPNGTYTKDFPAYSGSVYFNTLPTDYLGGWKVAPDGKTMLIGYRGGFQVGDGASAKWARFDDVPYVPMRDAIRQPRFPVGTTYSPDSKYALLSMVTHPDAWGGMNWPAENPCATQTSLIDTATGKPLWQLQDDQMRSAKYAVHTAYGAVSRDGAVSAFADYAGAIYIVDKNGAIKARETVNAKLPERFSTGPRDGVGLWLSDSGNLAAAAYQNLFLVESQNHFERIRLFNITGGCVSHDGSLAVAALESGEVAAFDPAGKKKWSFDTKGATPCIAAINDNNTLVAQSDGDLVLLDAAGHETRRTHLLETTEQTRHELKNSPQLQIIPPPPSYVEPNTLEFAKTTLGAQPIGSWKPSGAGVAEFGRTFYPASARISLSGKAPTGDSFLHLVYRRLPANTSLTVVVPLGKQRSEVFDLDLATPEYRVVDIPVQGNDPKVDVIPTGPVEIAECTLYSMRWPSPNLALVNQSKSSGVDLGDDKLDDKGDAESKADDALLKIKGEDDIVGKMKNCTIWNPNPDVDKITGAFLRAGVDALQMVDGNRFGNARVAPWKPGAFYVGTWMTIEFANSVPITLVATYDRAQKQSAVNRNIAVFADYGGKEKVLNGAIDNDQYWRVFPFNAPEFKTLGVHILAPKDEGLSEIEAYQTLDK